MMYYHVFLDTNVVLDFVLDRDPFKTESEAIFLLREKEKIAIYVSALSLANIAHLVKGHGRSPVVTTEHLLHWVNVIDLKRNHFERNIRSQFKDFEDGLQYYAALEVNNIDAIVTRDRTGFKTSDIPVLTPKEFLKQFES